MMQQLTQLIPQLGLISNFSRRQTLISKYQAFSHLIRRTLVMTKSSLDSWLKFYDTFDMFTTVYHKNVVL